MIIIQCSADEMDFALYYEWSSVYGLILWIFFQFNYCIDLHWLMEQYPAEFKWVELCLIY